ncbi:MAG TPA: chemotaxis protein CheB [Candidatus Polarisedimenticolia bacterium]|nr:chemotaxis protein CheB [Candidatus Polarisedimenticolia bacterium]
MMQKSQGKSKRRGAAKARVSQPRQEADTTIVAIGASAGGIEALTDLMNYLPADTGMAFVLVQHLDPKHHSILTELLARKTMMNVTEVSDGLPIKPNHVYVIPPNATMSISDHTLHLGPREESRGAHMSVDHFMRSLAEQKGNRAIGVILSGSGSDGTLGMAEIQAHGGVTFAQDDATAKYDGMPRSAVVAGCVDYVLPPKGIAKELARIARHPYVVRNSLSGAAEAAPAPGPGLNTIFHVLRRATGVDFTHYRQTTILRRIQRRMVVHKIDKIETYAKFMQSKPAEITALYQDMLINVTSFFRGTRVFEALKATVFPAIQKNVGRERGIRVWTPGCASGEETYSVAMALLEFLGDRASQIPIQFFGTDVSESSVARARNGVYPENIQVDVSPERLRRFFIKVENGYRVSKTIRDMCIFAQHNVLSDPPFSRMDLICCRNVLIYLEPVLQGKVISVFHYALRPSGFLVLGTSEGLGATTGLFAAEDRTNKIFSKKAGGTRQEATFSLNSQAERTQYGVVRIPGKHLDANWNYAEAQKEFDRRLLTQYTPATVFVNEEMEIIHTRGNVNSYLKLAPGKPSLSLLKMAREGLLVELRNAIARAKKENVVVGKRNLQLKNGDGSDEGARSTHSTRLVNFDVIPVRLGNFKELYFMIVFQEAPQEPERGAAARRTRPEAETETATRRTAKLEDELAATKEYLQSVIETQEATNEELQSANEEILSSNEELQSTNEEMETAKEELQSANEELTTVNDELRNRNTEITQINNDLINLLSSIDIAVIMIGSDMTIRRFTPKAQKFLGLIPGDVGRPLSNINPSIEIADLQAMVLQVVSDFRTQERELTDRMGVHYQFKILPYRTVENKIDGVVITIVDIAPDKAGTGPKGAS